MSVAERFSAAAVNPPLSQLSDAARAELGGVLGRVGAFEDLPGKWQAALLEAEAPPPELSSTARSCCCGGRRSPAAPAATPA